MFAPNESSSAMVNNGELGGQVRASGPPPQTSSCTLVAKYTASSVVGRMDAPQLKPPSSEAFQKSTVVCYQKNAALNLPAAMACGEFEVESNLAQ